MSFSSCFITSNVCKGCRDAVGGVKNVYVVAGCVTGTTENANQEILTVNLVFLKLQQSTRNQIKLLAQNTNLKVFVETNEGSIFYLGEDFGMALASGTAETGTAFADRYGYTIVMEGFEKEPAKKLAGSLSSTLVGLTLSNCPC
jgi:hypothetical protein